MTHRVVAALCLMIWWTSIVSGQDWSSLQQLPAGTDLTIEQKTPASGPIRGRLKAVDAAQLTLLVRERDLVLAQSDIERITRRRRDPVWQGLVGGALLALGLRVAFSGDSCARSEEPGCTLRGVAVGGALGALIDYSISGREVLYQAATPAAITRIRF